MSKLEVQSVEEIVNLTPQQMGMLLVYLKDRNSIINLVQSVLELESELEGDLDCQRVMNVFDAVVKKHAPMRSVFRWRGIKMPLHVVLKQKKPFYEYIDLTSMGGADLQRRLDTIVNADAASQFDLEQGTVRLTIVKTGGKRMTLLLTMHHIVCDGWSTSVILQEFLSLYSGDESEGFADYLLFKDNYYLKYARYIKGIDVKAHAMFWDDYLCHDKGTDMFLLNKLKSSIFEYNECIEQVGDVLVEQAEEFIKGRRLTMASFLFYAWGKTFCALMNTEKVTFNITVSTRIDLGSEADLNSSVGLFINTIPVLFSNMEEAEHFHARLGKLMDYAYLPIEGYRQPSDSLSILLVVENYPLDGLLNQKQGKIALKGITTRQVSGFDLTILMVLQNDMQLLVSYDRGIFNERTIGAMCRAFEDSISSIIAQKSTFTPRDLYIKEFINLFAPASVSLARADDQDNGVLYTETEKALAQIWAQTLGVDVRQLSAESNFLYLGGHSLSIIAMVNSIEKMFRVRIGIDKAFEFTKLSQLAQYIDQLESVEPVYLKKVEKQNKYPASSEQRTMYMMYVMDRLSTRYNVSAVYILKGSVSKENIEEALGCLLERHEALRTVYAEEDGQIYQVIQNTVDFCVEYCEKAGLVDIDKETANFVRPFDLNREIPFRAKVRKISKCEYAMMIDMHHIACDGVSTGIILREFMALYARQPLSAVKHQYKDYSQWQRSEEYLRIIESKKEYWINEFRDRVNFKPVSYEDNPNMSEHKGKQIFFTLDKATTSCLHELALTHKTSLFCVLLSAYFILMYKISGQTDMVIGAPAANRTHSDLSDIVGMFVNTLPVRMRLNAGDDYTRFINRLTEKWVSSLQRQEYKLDYLYSELSRIHGSVKNLFTAGFLLQSMDIPEFCVPDATIDKYRIINNTAKFNLIFITTEKEETIEVEAVYRCKYFDENMVEHIITKYLEIINKLISGNNLNIDDLLRSDSVLSIEDLQNSLE